MNLLGRRENKPYGFLVNVFKNTKHLRKKTERESSGLYYFVGYTIMSVTYISL